jgi:hypothetical protein
VAATANGLRIPSTADELAAETRNAVRRRFSSRSHGFCFNSDFAMGRVRQVNRNDAFPREFSPWGGSIVSLLKV